MSSTSKKLEAAQIEAAQTFKLTKDGYSLVKAYLMKEGYVTESSWADFLTYFNVEYAGDIMEVSIKYEKFKGLLESNPDALDKMWEFFDEVGIEGIHKREDLEKVLPDNWQTVGKYLEIGGYVIDVTTMLHGIATNDWGEIGGVLGGISGGVILPVLYKVIVGETPIGWLIIILNIIGSAFGIGVGSIIADFLQKEAKEMEQEILPYLNSSNTIQEAHIKYLYDEYNKKMK